MKKIRVVQFANTMSLGGSEKTMYLFCTRLNPERFEVFAAAKIHQPRPLRFLRTRLLAALGFKAYREKLTHALSRNARLPDFKKALGDDHLIVAKDWAGVKARLLGLQPDILHVHYGGQAEPPTDDDEVMSKVPIVVTTNIFPGKNTAPAHDKVARLLFVSHHLLHEKATWAKGQKRAQVLYNPIEKPHSDENLRQELGIPADAFVVGRVGRPDPKLHHPISLRAYRAIQTEKTYFLALAAPEIMKAEARELGLINFLSLPPTTDSAYLSRFYNTLDVLAHARSDGETFGCNIAEAMIHGRPVVSHRNPIANAQDEILADTGFLSDFEDDVTYAAHLRKLRDDQDFRQKLGREAKARALAFFEADGITRQLEKIYEELYAERVAV